MPSFTYHQVMKMLREHDRKFEFPNGHGNGHQKMIFHPELGFMPLPTHGNRSLSPHVLANISRKFKLPKDFFK